MIELRNVTKSYGKTLALDDFSLTVEEPGIYCLLGRNGAGKTTLMKLLAGYIPATTGTVVVNNRAVETLAMPEEVFYVESAGVQFNVRLDELVRYAEAVNPAFDAPFARELARRFKLDTKKRYKQLSFGMKVMVNTLIALASGKEILLLDEPVLGFDPVMRKIFYDLLQESCAKKPKTVIISTHIIDEIEKTAQQVLIVDKGRPLLFCDMTELDEKAYSVTGTAEAVKAATKGLRVLREVTAGGFLSRYVYDRRIEGGGNCSVSTLGLQDFFVALAGDEGEVM